MRRDTQAEDDSGSPGSHYRRNWRPATNADDYLRNCEAGLEKWSQRRLAKLMGVPRIKLYRWGLMADLPEEVFEALLAGGVRSSRALANVALAARADDPLGEADTEYCPHCGGVLRRRRRINRKAFEAIRSAMGVAPEPKTLPSDGPDQGGQSD
jgi:hypothetical protein